MFVAVLGGCTAGIADAALRPAPPFVASGATQITVEAIGRGAWLVRYRAPATWYAETLQQLRARGWTSADRVEYAPLNRAYTRATPLRVAVVWEWAFVRFDPLQPRSAEIRVRRAIDVPWWRSLRRLVSMR